MKESLSLLVAMAFVMGCGQGIDKRDHELEYCGTARDEAGCQAMGCDVALSGSMGRADESQCTIEPSRGRICFIDRGKKPLMSWGQAIVTYVREREDGSFDVMTLGSVYDEALPDWHSCLGDPHIPQCSLCEPS